MRTKDQGPCIWDYRCEKRGWGHGIQTWDLDDDDPRYINVLGHGSRSKPLVGQDPMEDIKSTARDTGVRVTLNGHYSMSEGDYLLVSNRGSEAWLYQIVEVDYRRYRDPRDMVWMRIRLLGPWDQYPTDFDESERVDCPGLVRVEGDDGEIDVEATFEQIRSWETYHYGDDEDGRNIGLPDEVTAAVMICLVVSAIILLVV